MVSQSLEEGIATLVLLDPPMYGLYGTNYRDF